MRRASLIAIALAGLLSGCEMLGIESPEKVAAAREADGKAIGAACRHAGRAIEDCYGLNRKSDRAAIFEGWRDMNDYMRENKIEAVAPQLGAPPASAVAKATDEAATDKPANKPEAKAKAGAHAS
jgi:hypothetical protein